jgi:hypothetical protein
MAKVYGLHTIQLKPGVDAAEFERFCIEEALPAYNRIPGNVSHLIKGDRGEQVGQYLVLHEVESVERRDALFPGGELSEEVQRLIAETAAVWEKLDTFVVASSQPHFTDYVEVGK